MCWPRTLSWRSDKNTECKMKQNSDEIPDCIVSSLPHNALCTVHRHWWFSREVCPGNWEELWGDHPRDHHLNISIFSCTKKVVSCCKNQNKNTKKFTLYRSWRRKEEKEMQAKRISGEELWKGAREMQRRRLLVISPRTVYHTRCSLYRCSNFMCQRTHIQAVNAKYILRIHELSQTWITRFVWFKKLFPQSGFEDT